MIECKTGLILAMTLAGQRSADVRPDAVGFAEDPATGVRCHYELEAFADRCPAIFEAVAEVWPSQVDDWGWPEPYGDNECAGTDGLDIYITYDATGGAYTVGPYVDADPDDGRMGTSSYIALAPGIQEHEYPGYIAHEFNHVLQFATDFTEPALVAWEGAATRAEEWTYPGEGAGPSVAVDFQDAPWVGLLNDSYLVWDVAEQYSLYEYGSVVFFDYMLGEYGVDAPDLWWSMTNETWNNEPDLLDAVGELTGDLEGAFLDFSVQRARIGTDTAPDWAAPYADAPIKVAKTLTTWADPIEIEKSPYDWGVVYFDVDVGEPALFTMHGGDAVEWRVVRVGDGDWMDVEAYDGVLIESRQLVGVAPLGAPDFDGDDITKERTLTVWLERPAGEGEDPVACACSTGPIGGAWWPLALLWARRRRTE